MIENVRIVGVQNTKWSWENLLPAFAIWSEKWTYDDIKRGHFFELIFLSLKHCQWKVNVRQNSRCKIEFVRLPEGKACVKPQRHHDDEKHVWI
jgi:hypothetical protein